MRNTTASKINTSENESTDRGFLWSLGGGLLASLCCVGPFVAVLIAGGGAAGAVGLVRFKLEFIAVGLLVTLIGIGLTLRRNKACCSVKTYRRNRILIPAVSLTVFALMVVGSNALLLNDRVIDAASGRLNQAGMTEQGDDPALLAAPALNRLDVEVTSGVYCPACLLGIQQAVQETAGVETASLNQGSTGGYVVRVEYDPSQVDQPTLVNTITNAPGAVTEYGTRVLSDDPIP
jgi:hypothetical protein